MRDGPACDGTDEWLHPCYSLGMMVSPLHRWGYVPWIVAALILAWSALAHAQAPRIIAETRVDIDGDGAPDVVSIEDPPAVSVAFAGKRGASATVWKPFAMSEGTLVHGTITTGRGKPFNNETVIVATALFAAPGAAWRSRPEDSASGEAMILAWQRGALVKIWEGRVGLQGPDGDYRVRVEAAPQGLLRYQARPDIRRCDGQGAYLFAEGYDFRQKRFRDVFNVPRIPRDAPVLTAVKTAPSGAGMGPAVAFRSESASSQAEAAHAGELVPPRELDDGDPRTVWREGTGGNGRGEFITLTTPLSAPAVLAVRIIPGDATSRDLFLRGNRLKRAGLLIDATKAFWIEFPTDPARDGRFDEPYWITLPGEVRGQCVTLVVAEVYPGAGAGSARGGDTALADLAVLTELDLSTMGPDAALTAQVAQGGPAGDSAAHLLAARGPRATSAILASIQAAGRTPAELVRLRRVLARIGDPRAADQMVEGLAMAEAGSADKQVFASALTRMGAEAIPPVSALLLAEDADSASRQAAARVLATLRHDAAHDALLRAAGKGDRALRQVVAHGLGQLPAARMDLLLGEIAAATASGDIGREADLWRALGLMARHADAGARADTRDRAASAMAARVATAGGYELLYRLLGAMAGLDHEGALQALDQALARNTAGTSAEDRALRRVAASALARNPGTRARILLLGLASDPDPGVRTQALAGLGERGDLDADTDRVMIERLQADTWPRIRQAAASGLARRCGSAQATALALDRAVDRDPHIDVRRASLSSLVECRAPGIGPRLIQVASDRAKPALLRQRAITLIPVLGDRDLSPALIELFASLRKQAWSEKDAVRLASAAAVAMGRLGAEAVIAPLLEAARDPSFPEIQAAAITGLGELCPPRAMPIFESQIASSQRAVAIAARGARNRCRGLRE